MNEIEVVLENKSIKLSEIDAIDAYKVDLLTMDDIRFDIYVGDSVYTLSEDNHQFNQLDKIFAEYLEGYMANWREVVVLPAFETNMTRIYGKSDK